MSDSPGMQWLVTELEFWKARARSLEREAVARDEAAASDLPPGLVTTHGTIYPTDLAVSTPFQFRTRVYSAVGEAVMKANAVTVLRERAGSALMLRVLVYRQPEGLSEAALERVVMGGTP